MCRYDTLREIKLWEDLKVNYQEEIEMGKDIEQNTFLVSHAEEQIDLLNMRLSSNEYAKNKEGVTSEQLTALHDKAMKNFDKARALQETIMIHLHKYYCVQIFCVTTDGTFLNSLDFKVVSKKNENITDLERRIIQELNEEYNPQLYQVVTETLYAFKRLLINKIKI